MLKVGEEPRELGQNRELELILKRWSNINQLLTNGGFSSKRFIQFKLFLPKSKSLNLGFLLKN